MRSASGAAKPFRIVHISDIHLGESASQREDILVPLVRSLAEARGEWEEDARPPLLCITGDLHDSPSRDVAEATHDFIDLLERIRTALGSSPGARTPTVLLPGNHDRRTRGLVLPYRTTLMDALVTANLPSVVVVGVSPPFLSQHIPDAFHGLPFSVAAIDSSYTPTGFVGAGGLLRAEDLLELAVSLEGVPADRPLLLLTHHHLVSTPVADTATMDASTESPVLRWLSKHLLSRIVPYANHEEWMMTALGAGTALSTLSALGRPVLVLHGHKHYPTVRVLSGTVQGHGDVILLSAGSAGLALPLGAADQLRTARLWPSFHILTLDEATVRARTIGFYKDAETSERDLLHAEAMGRRWDVRVVQDTIRHSGPELRRNEATFTLQPSAARAQARWDLDVVRIVQGELDSPYQEEVRAASGARFEPGAGDTRSITIPTDGSAFAYRLRAGLVRTVRESLSEYGALAPFEGVELLNRYQCAEATMVVRGLPPGSTPFGSTTDLTRGQSTPCPLERRADGSFVLRVAPCSPRMQLRIQWRPEP